MAEDQPQVRSAIPEKEDNLKYCLRNLLAADISPVTMDTIDSMARDNTQLLVNQIHDLEHVVVEEGILAQLPATETYRLPREKPLPKEKAQTRWEKFAKEKGIEKRKRGRMVWNDTVKDWVPRHGYGSTKHIDDKLNNWVIEVKPGQDPYEDPFEKRNAEKKLVQAKQKMRELRNKAEAIGEKLPFGIFGTPNRVSQRGKAGLQEVGKRAARATASVGKFDREVKNQGKQKVKKRTLLMKGDEKMNNMRIMTKMLTGGAPQVDKSKAAKIAIAQSEKKKKKK